jgi:hypothetical protein
MTNDRIALDPVDETTEVRARWRPAPPEHRPDLTVTQILEWADAHHRATGRRPNRKSGTVIGTTNGESWYAIDRALRLGGRGLPGGTALTPLLLEERGRISRSTRPALRVEEILAWADEYHRLTGRWPRACDRPKGLPLQESWRGINRALREGHRCLPGGSSLASLLQEHRGVRGPSALPPLTVAKILAWADAHHHARGKWPTPYSGPIPGAPAPGEIWRHVEAALRRGGRGLPGGTSLADLLAEHRGVPVRGR